MRSCCVGGRRLFSDNEGCASTLCMFPIEKYGAEEKGLFEVREKKLAVTPGNARMG